MIYDKLPVVFLSTIASEEKDSTNSQIAACILDHLQDMQHIGIRELAAECSVAMSSVSRFCKDIGLRDFAELKDLLLSTSLYFQEQPDAASLQERLRGYGEKVKDSIGMVEDSVDMKAVEELCGDIRAYGKVAVLGLLKAGGVALNLQGDLLMLGKRVYTGISYTQQIRHILEAGEDELILIFSYTGSYFQYMDQAALKRKKKMPKIWLVSGQTEKKPLFADRVITFRSMQDQNSHPYQLQFIAGLIAQEYARQSRTAAGENRRNPAAGKGRREYKEGRKGTDEQ